ncbi:unnamed protein product [Mycena citricolor]|uniref:Methyltransferase domain-containing protein n=1 Tax=Mycena citricolor TaxID=2018698 RepID=A0AAD2JYD6_9AGAR|nr:unnamed protein product [Mycena citricolor]
MDQSVAERIASLSGYGPTSSVPQAQYRLDVVSKWPIHAGARVLELGCGQGDTTLALAESVGASGHVYALDPGPTDYGSPTTLGEAHDVITAGPLGSRITWIQDEPLAYLSSHPDSQYDVVVLAHSLWYFASPSLIAETLRVLKKHARHICIAEWSLSYGKGSSGETHVLAVLAQAALECRKPTSTSNVRTVVSPARIKALAAQAGLTLASEHLVAPGQGVHDGRWETQHVLSSGFLKEVEQFVLDEREKDMVIAFKDSVAASVDRIGGTKQVQSMDGWTATFESSNVEVL